MGQSRTACRPTSGLARWPTQVSSRHGTCYVERTAVHRRGEAASPSGTPRSGSDDASSIS